MSVIRVMIKNRYLGYALLLLSFVLLSTKSYAQGLIETQRMAEQGDAQAQFVLGTSYARGEGVAQDAKQAMIWYRKAAEQDNEWAQLLLGAMYANGEGVAQDAKQAVTWYRKAAEQGLPQAQYSLGLRYAEGLDVPQDNRQAYAWLSVAFANGHSSAKKYRDLVAKRLSKSQLEDAQRLAGQYFDRY